MAKILFINVPAHGHANPSFPLVAELVKSGHQVDYYLTEEFRKKVELVGANLIPYKTKYSADLKNKFHIVQFFNHLIRTINENLDKLVPNYDLVVVCAFNFFVKKIQQNFSLPVVYCSAVFLQNEETIKYIFGKTWKEAPKLVKLILTKPILRKTFTKIFFNKILGFPITDVLDIFKPANSVLNIVLTSRYYQPLESFFDKKCLFIGHEPTINPKNPNFPLNMLKNSNKKIIYVTLGTIFNTWIDFFRNNIKAFVNTDYLVVISTGRKETVELIGKTPDNIFVYDFVPQAEVLEYASLFIAHGSMGSISDGISLGVPMVLVPLGADQFVNSHRLQELGACKILNKKDVTHQKLKEVVVLTIENQTYLDNIKKVQESFKNAGGPKTAIKEIENLLEH